ncbi:hypothetical protein BGK72_00180 [Streptomyces agglomeratus]|nr:hypothetical protein BGK72_00180 [Streptomyces agglomeratus]
MGVDRALCGMAVGSAVTAVAALALAEDVQGGSCPGRPMGVRMIGSERPAWTPAARSGCQVLRDQLVEVINAVRSQAAGMARLAQALDPVDEGRVTPVTGSEQSVAALER